MNAEVVNRLPPFRTRDARGEPGWSCVVDGKLLGPWPTKGAADTAYRAELIKITWGGARPDPSSEERRDA